MDGRTELLKGTPNLIPNSKFQNKPLGGSVPLCAPWFGVVGCCGVGAAASAMVSYLLTFIM